VSGMQGVISRPFHSTVFRSPVNRHSIHLSIILNLPLLVFSQDERLIADSTRRTAHHINFSFYSFILSSLSSTRWTSILIHYIQHPLFLLYHPESTRWTSTFRRPSSPPSIERRCRQTSSSRCSKKPLQITGCSNTRMTITKAEHGTDTGNIPNILDSSRGQRSYMKLHALSTGSVISLGLGPATDLPAGGHV